MNKTINTSVSHAAIPDGLHKAHRHDVFQEHMHEAYKAKGKQRLPHHA